MSMTAQPGDVILVRFPFTNLTAAKLRPALVLATHGDDITIVGIFSTAQQRTQETWVVLSPQDPDFSLTGLLTASVIKGERIAVIERSLVTRKLGSLPTPRMEKVKRAVKLALQLD
jgi:mRNA interferase MazF